MAKKLGNRAILAKIETTYGTDAVPTGAANAMMMINVTYEPLLGQDVSRDLILPYMGHQGVLLVGNYARLTGEIELAGSGTPGTPPAYGPLLRACAMAEVITASTSAAYNPISAGQEAVSIYYNMDGVNHVLLGARGTFTLDMKPAAVPRLKFVFTGLLGTIADVALPTVTLTAFKTPLPVSKANTTFSLHGLASACEGVSFDLANQIEPRLLIGYEGIEHVDRDMTGSAVLEAVAIATKDWLSIARAHTKGVLALVHGTVAGNIVQLDAPAVQIGRPNYGDTQKIINNTLPLMFMPSTGNDEFKITVK